MVSYSGVNVFAIDPGTTESAWVHFRDGMPVRFCKEPNALVRQRCEEAQCWGVQGVAIEMIASYGLPVGAEVFDTCIWIGRFYESLVRCNIQDKDIELIKRLEVKSHLCHSAKANDATIRQALIDRWGPGKERAVGTKKQPGPLYGLKADCWSSLAIAVTWADRFMVRTGMHGNLQS